jgi:hypothetical protein
MRGRNEAYFEQGAAGAVVDRVNHTARHQFVEFSFAKS